MSHKQIKMFKQYWTIERSFSNGMIEVKAVKANKAGWRRVLKIFPEVYVTVCKNIQLSI